MKENKSVVTPEQELKGEVKHMKRFLWNKKAVSPVIGTILMVAVTVVMAAIIGGFVYQMGRPTEVPNIATSLLDDVRVILTDNTSTGNGRIAKLTFETGDVIAPNEVIIVATYTDNLTEITEQLEGSDLAASANVTMGTNKIMVQWVDSDGTGDLSPGDRLDFYEPGTTSNTGQDVTPNTDFTVKITHKSSKSTISNHSIKVY